MFAPKRILVPTDFSGDSDEALKEALELAKQYNSKVYLLHVTEPLAQCAVDYCVDIATVHQAEADEVNRSKEMMQRELAKFAERQGIEVITDIREGDTVAEILKEQDEKGVDLIVMPSHRKAGLLKRFMGMVSEKVMEGAKSPVLLVKH